LSEWQNAVNLLRSSEIVVGVREGHDVQELAKIFNSWGEQPMAWHLFESFAADVSSNKIREALRKRSYVRGLLTSVARYANRNWLYISLGKN
jgi:nicotinic acid mononucleotide adenylyltransferase